MSPPFLTSAVVAIAAVRLAGASDIHIPFARSAQAPPITFESVQEERTLHLSLPRDTTLQSGHLRLDLQWSPLLRQPSNLRVTVENTPTRVIPLTFGTDAPVRVELPLEASVLARRSVRIRLAVTALASHDVCLDEKLRPGFLQILTASGLVVQPDAEPRTVAAVLDRLPPEVHIALPPGQPDLALWRAAWEIATLLQSTGHTPRIVRLPEPAHIVVAPGQPGLVPTPAGPVLRVTPGALAAGQLAPDWPQPATATGKDVRGESLRIGLETLHPASTLRDASWRADWNLSPPALPPGYRITRAKIRIAQTPGTRERPTHLFVYADGTLTRTIRLADHGEPQEFRLDLPAADQVRVVTQRAPAGGECLATIPPSPSQLLPGTELIATPVPLTFPTLAMVRHRFRSPARLYIDANTSANLEALPALTAMIARLGLDPAQAEVHVLTRGSRPAADRPFVLIATDAPPGVTSPVRFDRGGITLTDSLNRTLFRTPSAPEVTVVQVLAGGAWIRPASGLTSISELELGHGDVAFLDASGLVRSFHSRQVEIAQLHYTDLTTWTDWIGNRSPWLFGAAWVLVTIIFVGLYRRLLRHKELA